MTVHMQDLIKAGLFGRGLVQVNNTILVERYNACLRDMGLEPTKLKKFQIDRMGWSPEIAAEMDNDYYLSHGDANPLAIILTPDQGVPGTPIYYPYHSFDWRMMNAWYSTYRAPIVDLTESTGICLDIDQDVDVYQDPDDLLLVYEVLIKASTPGRLITKAKRQQELILRFLREEESHLNAELIEELRQSRIEAGDLRNRMLVIRDHQFSDIRDFYSRPFGGVFVLRSRSEKPLVICRKGAVAKQFNLPAADVRVIGQLKKFGYVENNLEWWRGNLSRLRMIAESYFVDMLDAAEPEMDYLSIDPVIHKALVRKHEKELEPYLLLRALCIELQHNKKDVEVPAQIAHMLVHPAQNLNDTTRDLIWQLLSWVKGGRIIPLYYRHWKTAFVEAYTQKWNRPKRTWALARVREHYELASMSSTVVL